MNFYFEKPPVAAQGRVSNNGIRGWTRAAVAATCIVGYPWSSPSIGSPSLNNDSASELQMSRWLSRFNTSSGSGENTSVYYPGNSPWSNSLPAVDVEASKSRTQQQAIHALELVWSSLNQFPKWLRGYKKARVFVMDSFASAHKSFLAAVQQTRNAFSSDTEAAKCVQKLSSLETAMSSLRSIFNGLNQNRLDVKKVKKMLKLVIETLAAETFKLKRMAAPETAAVSSAW